MALTWKMPDPTKTDVVISKTRQEENAQLTSITAQLHHQRGIS
jgi:hypothetical protein